MTTMSNDMIISEAIEYINELFAGNSDGHGADHTMRVYHNTQILLEAYPEADGFVSLLAALLHDVGKLKIELPGESALISLNEDELKPHTVIGYKLLKEKFKLSEDVAKERSISFILSACLPPLSSPIIFQNSFMSNSYSVSGVSSGLTRDSIYSIHLNSVSLKED